MTSVSPLPELGLTRGDVAVLIPVYGGHELFLACLASVLAHTSPEVPILVCDDASPDARPREHVRELMAAQPERRLHLLVQPRNLGFPGNVNAGFAATAPADVIILNSDCEVGADWVQRLVAAARSDATVATATALTNHGTVVSTPAAAPGPLPAEWTVDQAAEAIAAASLRLRPRLPTAVGHCVLIRRAALELVGDLDLAFSPGYGEEVDFSQRCLQAGLCHVVADDVFVLHHGGSSFERSGDRSEIQLAHEAIINARYPYYAPAVAHAEAELGQLARALSVARRALSGTEVLIDARVLSSTTTGTQVHLVELLGALARAGQVRLTALVGAEISAYGAAALARMPQVATIRREEAQARSRRFDVVHRPFQVDHLDDIALLRRLADRVVVTNQDLIGYHNPAYFPDYAGWAGYRAITRAALASADAVLFFSQHAQAQALAENLVEPSRTRVIHIGVDHVLSAPAEPQRPRGLADLDAQTPVMVCIGTDFLHKNRVFALRMLAELQRRHAWPGRLILAGPSVTRGSSRGQEARRLSLDPGLAAAVTELGALTEAEKSWLLARAQLVLYPTVHEGFGLVPFEAAEHGRPCMWAAGTSLSEVLDDGAAGLVAWDPALSADAAFALMSDPERTAANVAAIRTAGAALSWDATAAELLRAYRDAADGPAVPGGAEPASGLSAGVLQLSEDAINLVGPGGALPGEMERPLLALATHRSLGGPIFAGVRLAYRVGFALSRARRGLTQE